MDLNNYLKTKETATIIRNGLKKLSRQRGNKKNSPYRAERTEGAKNVRNAHWSYEEI